MGFLKCWIILIVCIENGKTVKWSENANSKIEVNIYHLPQKFLLLMTYGYDIHFMVHLLDVVTSIFYKDRHCSMTFYREQHHK